MKQLLLSGIAALFLATGTAHAYPPRYYDCGKAFVKIQTGKGTAPSGNRVFPTTWTIAENWEKEDRKTLPPISSLNFRCIGITEAARDDKCWLNGKFCRKMTTKRGKRNFPMRTKLLLSGIAALFLATGPAHAGDIPDGKMPLKIPPGFDESFPPLGYPRFCICMGEEPNGSRFMYPTYCVLDISKIPSTCVVPSDPKKPTPSIEKYTMRCGDIEAIVTVNRKYDDLGGFNKIDVYVADPKILKQNETKGGYLYLNGKLCTPTKIWTCPDKTSEGVC